jgi:ABC-2 type transport system ATP-binding protein
MEEKDTSVAISIQNVSKDFVLPHEKVDSLKSAFVNPFKKRKGAEVQRALKDISFEVKEGEFFGIVGRNGSGKSTLLKIIAEIYQPTKGKLYRKGKLVPFIELGVGFNPELTGRENVYLNGALLGFSTKEVDEMYEDIVDFAELSQFMDQKLKNYSSGMQVRLAFSVATRAKADILLIDEVLAVGDADFQRKCFNYFKSLKKDAITVIFVSHDMDAVREYCDRAVLIDKSVIVDMGDPDEIAQQYTKLFTDVENVTTEGSEEGRWGNGDMKTSSITVDSDEKTIQIHHQAVAAQDLTDPIIGIRIRSVSGESITGTNTKIENIKIGSVTKGQTIHLTWTLPNVLADGQYFIDPAILASDGVEVFDWWDEARKFKVNKKRNLPYSVDPHFAVEVVNR